MYIGLDIGSSGTKAGIYNKQGEEMAFSKVSYTFDINENDKKEFEASTFMNATTKVLNEVINKYKRFGLNEKIKNITVSSLGEAVAPIDNSLNPLYNFVAGSDTRKNIKNKKIKSLDFFDIAEKTGLSYGELYSAYKILFIKDQIDTSRLYKWVNVQDYIIAKLTGEPFIDYSMASRTLLFDINTKKWSKDMLKIFGLTEDYLPKIVIAGTPVGTILESVKKEINIDYDIEVVVGTHDHIANALGSGVIHEGWACNTVGTTEGFTVMLGNRLTSNQIVKSGISSEPSVKENLFNTVAWHNTAGGALDWFIRNFSNKDEGFETFEKNCKNKPSGLIIKPLFSGQTIPKIDVSVKGSIHGLRLDTNKYQLYQGIMEGTSFELRKIFEILKENGIKITDIVVTGGGTKSKKWMQLKSDILSKNLLISKYSENGSLGSAIIGAVAARDYENIEKAVYNMKSPYYVIYPNKENVKQYNELFNDYMKL